MYAGRGSFYRLTISFLYDNMSLWLKHVRKHLHFNTMGQNLHRDKIHRDLLTGLQRRMVDDFLRDLNLKRVPIRMSA